MSGPWPTELVLRLHLAGLERLDVASGTQRLELSVLSHSGHRVLQTHAGDTLTPDDPRRATLTVHDGQGRATSAFELPLAEGYFEVRLPASLLVDAGDTLAIAWIDFYR